MTEEHVAAIDSAHKRIDALEAKFEKLTAKLKLHGIHAEEEHPTAAEPEPKPEPEPTTA